LHETNIGTLSSEQKLKNLALTKTFYMTQYHHALD
jgi:hypothetical protein